MPTSDLEMCVLREKVARLEEKILAADKALDLARFTVSRNSIFSVITVIISVLSIMYTILKNHQ